MHPYQNSDAVLTTKHGKLELFQTAFQELGLKITVAELDTDALGTFSGETARVKSALDTAVEKARLGMAATGSKLGFASEGTIGSDALIPFLNSDVEVAVLVDDQAGIVIWESYRSLDIVAFRKEVGPETELMELLNQIDFPNQRLIVSSLGAKEVTVLKGIADMGQLQSTIAQLAEESQAGKVVLEPDFRAHYCPSRRINIQRAAELLARRVATLCKSCGTPGFGQVRHETGLHCAACGLLDQDAISREVLCCVKCELEEAGRTRDSYLSPENCSNCNP